MKLQRYRVPAGSHFRLRDHDPADRGGLRSKEEASERLKRGVDRLCELQDKLYAEDRWAVLLILQALDAAGKDSAIKHVMSGVNPQGCSVVSFKRPSDEELNHDYLWRTTKALPERGKIGIFNRSYYEEVLVVRVHQELLDRQKLPKSLVTKPIWRERFDDINAFERHLTRSGYAVLKVFLHVSKEEQRKRFLARLDDPTKLWKFSEADVEERRFWNDYHDAYEDAIGHTSTDYAPWYVVPADHKWFSRLVIAEILVDALEGLKLEYPTVDAAKRKELARLRARLR
jgi:PPK2 family polyphosphate:nucleotide phosphotransferase